VTRALAALVGIALAAPAAAQSPEPSKGYESTVHARPRRDDGDPVLVLSARELQQRGAQNLKEALDLIPEVQIRQGGMGTRLDVRGAKQRSILLLLDGIPIDEPYNGAFELSSIPITDIVEIRVQLAPASPLEGPGGDGGIVEVFTLRATGDRRIDGRVVGGTQPYGEGAVTGRAPLVRSGALALRASAGAHFSDAGYPVAGANMTTATFFDRDHQEYAALRLEYATARARVTGDVWYGHRAYYIPPTDLTGVLLQNITGQDAMRAVVGSEIFARGFRLAVGGYGELLSQSTDFYTDYTQSTKVSRQKLIDGRAGIAAQLDRPWRVRDVRIRFSARLSVDGEGARIAQTSLPVTSGISTFGELALGARVDWRGLRVDAAVGGLLPFGNPSAAWPEAKVTVGVRPWRGLTVLLIGARKGRLPTIRELYDPIQGNPKLSPEFVWHGEVQFQARPHPLLGLHFSGYFRRIDGTIRLDPTTGGGMGNMNALNANLDTINVRGCETGFDVARERVVGGGFTYVFEDAYSLTLGNQPIANFPNHKIDAYVSSTVWRKRLGALARVRFVSERLVQSSVLPRYTLLELDVWARLSSTIRASLRVDNLTNATYQLLPGLNALGTTATATVEGVWE